MTTPILEFRNEYRWLSNFWPSPIQFGGKSYPTVEHAYQALKSTDPDEAEGIRTVTTAGVAKKLGKTIKIRSDWEDIKVHVMFNLCKLKFLQNKELGQKLLNTGDAELIEGNAWHDTFWGVCNGVGQNNLGKILMTIRNDLQFIENLK